MNPDPLPVQGPRSDPSVALVAVFRAVATRMEGLTFVNPALAVDAIGFAPWDGCWLGVLLTPWFMNLALAPRDPAQWIGLPPGAKRSCAFPAGDFDFIGAHDDVFGDFQMCSLFSPVLEFADQASALLVGQLARDALFDVENAESPGIPAAGFSSAEPGPVAAFERRLTVPISRQDFLRGRLGKVDHESRG